MPPHQTLACNWNKTTFSIGGRNNSYTPAPKINTPLTSRENPMNSQMESDPPARLDDDQTFLSRNSAGITEGRTEIQCFPFFDEGAARDASVVGADAASVRKESAGTTRTNPIIPASSCSNR
jgi:hypothetical protein